MPAPLRLCAFGDSFVNGTGDSACLGWLGRAIAARKADGADITFYNLGIRGDTIAQIAARWQAEAQARLGTLPADQRRILFSFGANDAAQAIDPVHSLLQAEDMLTRARALAPLLWIGPAPIAGDIVRDDRIADLCRAFQTLAHRLDLPYLPIHAALRATHVWQREALAGDGAHPDAQGYAALADLVQSRPAWRDFLPTT